MRSALFPLGFEFGRDESKGFGRCGWWSRKPQEYRASRLNIYSFQNRILETAELRGEKETHTQVGGQAAAYAAQDLSSLLSSVLMESSQDGRASASLEKVVSREREVGSDRPRARSVGHVATPKISHLRGLRAALSLSLSLSRRAVRRTFRGDFVEAEKARVTYSETCHRFDRSEIVAFPHTPSSSQIIGDRKRPL